MDDTLIFLLIGFVLIDIQAYYFGFISPPPILAWLQQACFTVFTFLLIPLLIYVLYSQAGSVGRLEQHGIESHPAIQHAIGIANGLGENPTWVFQLNSDEDNLLAFYKQSLSSAKWKLTEETELYLRYTLAEQTLTIAQRQSATDNTLTIMIRKKP